MDDPYEAFGLVSSDDPAPGGVHEGKKNSFFRFLDALFANFQKPSSDPNDDGCGYAPGGPKIQICFTKLAPGDPPGNYMNLGNLDNEWGSNPGRTWAWMPSWAINAWLNFQWSCWLGPSFATQFNVGDLRAWQLACPIYCVATQQQIDETVDNPLDLQIVEMSRIDRAFHMKRDFHNKWQFSSIMYEIYVSAFMNIDELWPGRGDDWWPLLYAMYNTSYGKMTIENWVVVMQSNNDPPPPAVLDVLQNNYTGDVQRQYGILNEPDLTPDNVVNNINHFRIRGPLFKTIAGSRPNKRWGFPFWTNDQRKSAFMLILPHVASLTDGQWSIRYDYVAQYLQVYIDNGWLVPDDSENPSTGCPSGTTAFGDGSACQSNTDPTQKCSIRGTEYPSCRPAIYDPTKHPVKVVEPITGKSGIDSGITVAGYSGKLPSPGQSVLQGQTPWAPPATDPNHAGYDIPCGDKTFSQKIIIYAGSVVAAAVPAIFLPGFSRVSGAATAGTASYFFLQNVIGTQDDPKNQKNAATIVAVGAPVTAALMVYDLNLQSLLPSVLDDEFALTVGSGASGYLFLESAVENVLGSAGTIANFLTTPLAALDEMIAGFTNGCFNHTFAQGCKCENSQSKEKFADVLLNTVYGATDDQSAMRMQCLKAGMSEGEWGTDPVTIGKCGAKGIMDNPAACIIPDYWLPQYMDPKDQLVSGMFDSISPCLDPSNRSFLPPGYTFNLNSKDTPLTFDANLKTRDDACVTANGKYSRWDQTGCRDTSKISVRGGVSK